MIGVRGGRHSRPLLDDNMIVPEPQDLSLLTMVMIDEGSTFEDEPLGKMSGYGRILFLVTIGDV